jgi:hypothetical protein
MLALLKLISPKEWLLLAVIVAFGIYTARIYRDGEQRIEAKDAALRAAAVALNKASEQLADLKEIQIERTYTHIVDAPAIKYPNLVCRNTAAAVKPDAAKSGGSADNSAPDVLPTGSGDIGGSILTLLRNADAQVNALIDRNAELEGLLEGVTK